MKFCNIDINLTNKEELFQNLNGETKFIVTVNAQIIVLANENQRLLEFINKNYATVDGEIPLKIAKILYPDFKDVIKLSGSDIVYDFCDYAKKNDLKLFFLGGKESSVRNAVENVRKKYAIQVDGFSPEFEDYPFSDRFIRECQSSIRKFKPDILFVGFGAGKQEYFIESNRSFLQECKIQYVVGSGGTVDFVSGSIKRAPKWISKIGLEGFYRFFQEMSIARAKRILISFKFFKYIR
ncbi:MAG: WecB/TagA/CpsF family glycosyltransferase [Lachnospiraceae bacterium]|nr:WecB/TagA/CpsF family glycosyltransferase [Lachnospiraceae bacterium]